MKIIKVPYNSKIHSILELLEMPILVLIFSVSSTLFIEGNWGISFVFLIFALVLAWFLWEKWHLRIVICHEGYVLGFLNIVNLTESGFEVIKCEKAFRYDWKDIKEVKLESKPEEHRLVFTFYTNKRLVLTDYFINWYLLIQHIPEEKMLDNHINEFVIELFKSLATCKVCGKIAFHNKKCLSCEVEELSPEELSEYRNKEEYIRLEQLSLFGTEDENEAVNFRIYDGDGFSFDENWKPLVTENEVIAYSKAHYW